MIVHGRSILHALATMMRRSWSEEEDGGDLRAIAMEGKKELDEMLTMIRRIDETLYSEFGKRYLSPNGDEALSRVRMWCRGEEE